MSVCGQSLDAHWPLVTGRSAGHSSLEEHGREEELDSVKAWSTHCTQAEIVKIINIINGTLLL